MHAHGREAGRRLRASDEFVCLLLYDNPVVVKLNSHAVWFFFICESNERIQKHRPVGREGVVLFVCLSDWMVFRESLCKDVCDCVCVGVLLLLSIMCARILGVKNSRVFFKGKTFRGSKFSDFTHDFTSRENNSPRNRTFPRTSQNLINKCVEKCLKIKKKCQNTSHLRKLIRMKLIQPWSSTKINPGENKYPRKFLPLKYLINGGGRGSHHK